MPVIPPSPYVRGAWFKSPRNPVACRSMLSDATPSKGFVACYEPCHIMALLVTYHFHEDCL